ncbi:MAG: hypothetical protein HQ513_17515 [Rhodospirillales bacterium]|nr:hypothetical protein [Rhodospirillales bacterium]
MSNNFNLTREGISVPEGAVMELVAFTVKEEAVSGFEDTQRSIHEFVSTMPGYISSIGLKGLDENNTFVDLALWDSLDNALAASKAFENSPACGPVMEKISEVKVMTHLTTI